MKRIHRLRLLPAAALVALGAAVPLAGQTASASAQGHSAASFTLKFATFFSDPEKAEFNQRILPLFQKQYPGVSVALPSIPSDRGLAVTQIAAGKGADVTNLGDGDVGYYVDHNVLADLVPYLGRGFLNQYLPNTLTIGRVGSHQYSLPKDYSTLAVYYNKALFKAAGVPFPPASGFTWSQFRSDALALSKKSGAYSVQYDPSWSRLADLVVRSFGGRLISADGKHIVGYMDSPATVKAITFWSGLTTQDHVAPTPSQFASATNGGADPFAQGKVAMNVTGIWPSPTYNTTANLSYGVVSFPQAAGAPPNNTICYAGFAMARTTQHPKEVAALIKLMSGPVGDAIWGKVSLPAVKAVADKNGDAMDPVRGVFLNGVKNIRQLPGDITGPEAAAAVGDTLHEGLTLLDGSPGTPVQQVLTIEAKKGQAALGSTK